MHFLNQIVIELSQFSTQLTYGKGLSHNINNLLNEKVYLLLQKSILSGEYYDPKAEDKITEIESQLNNLELIISVTLEAEEVKRISSKLNPTQEKELQAFLLEEMPSITSDIKHFRYKYLDTLKELAKSVRFNLQFFSSGQEGKIVDTKPLRNYKIKNELASIIGTNLISKTILNDSLYEINILLAYTDEYLECKDDVLTELRSIREYLKDELTNKINGEILALIRDKAGFLEYKIQWRNGSPQLPPANTFNSLKDKITSHYRDLSSTYPKLSKQRIENQTADLRLEDFHHANRYYRRVDNDSSFKSRKVKIRSFLTIIVEQRKEIDKNNLFDKIAYDSFYNLLFNSLIDIELKLQETKGFSDIIQELRTANGNDDNVSSKYLDEKKEWIKSFVNNGQMPDYYCFKRYIDFLNSLINHLLLNPDAIIPKSIEDDSDYVKQKKRILAIVKYLKGLYEESIKDLRSNLKIMMTHEVKPVYLTFNECLLQYKWKDDGHNGSLFLDSSYILPNNFDKVKSEINAKEMNLPALLNPLISSFETVINAGFIEKKNKAFETKVKENEFKVVQIVAMFVSIATFVLINVKIFDNKSGLESFAIILGLAACFFLFNLFFYIIILAFAKHPAQFWKQNRNVLWLLIIPIVFGLVSFTILNGERNKGNTEIKALKEKIRTDSLEFRRQIDASREKIRTDSLEFKRLIDLALQPKTSTPGAP